MSTRRSRRSRRPYHHGDLRAALVRAAAELLEEQGAAVLSLRETARRAAVSHAAPYRHFKDREALLAAVAADGFALLARSLGGGNVRPGASEMGEAYVRFALEHPQRFRLMFGGLLPIGAYAELRESASRAYAALSGVYAALGGEREARIAAAAAWSLVHGLSHLLLDGHFEAATQRGQDSAGFVREVIGAVRFSLGAQRSA